jgi:hypothetical protein
MSERTKKERVKRRRRNGKGEEDSPVEGWKEGQRLTSSPKPTM